MNDDHLSITQFWAKNMQGESARVYALARYCAGRSVNVQDTHGIRSYYSHTAVDEQEVAARLSAQVRRALDIE